MVMMRLLIYNDFLNFVKLDVVRSEVPGLVLPLKAECSDNYVQVPQPKTLSKCSNTTLTTRPADQDIAWCFSFC